MDERDRLQSLKERASWSEDGSDREADYYEAYLHYTGKMVTDWETGESVYISHEGMGW